jgi:hypothetical protein
MENHGDSSRKLKLELMIQNPPLGLYPKELKSECQSNICTFMFLPALFAKAKIFNQPECPPNG